MLRFAVDLIVFLSLAAQFAIAGLLPLPGLLADRAAGDRPVVPPPSRRAGRRAGARSVYNEPLVFERALLRRRARLPRTVLTIQAARRQPPHHPGPRRPRRGRRRRDCVDVAHLRRLTAAASMRARLLHASPSLTRPTLGVRRRRPCRPRLAGKGAMAAESCPNLKAAFVLRPSIEWGNGERNWRPGPAPDAGCPLSRSSRTPRPLGRGRFQFNGTAASWASRPRSDEAAVVARYPLGISTWSAHAPQGCAAFPDEPP